MAAARNNSDQAAVSLFDETSTVTLTAKNGGKVLIVGSVHAGFDTAAQFAEAAKDFDATMIAAELGPARFKIMKPGGKIVETVVPQCGDGSFALPSLASVCMLLGQLPMALVMSAVADSEYGDDMASAIRTAQNMSLPLYLCDRSQAVTLSRVGFDAGSLLPRWYWGQLLFGLLTGHRNTLASGVQAMLEEDSSNSKAYMPANVAAADACITRTVVSVLRRGAATPGDGAALRGAIRLSMTGSLIELQQEQDKSFARAMITERDAYMAHTLYHSPAERTIALVGLGHLPGIKKHWGRTRDEDIAPLLQAPRGFYLFNAVAPLATLGAVGYGLKRLHTSRPRLAWGLAGAGVATLGAVGFAAVAVKRYTEEVVDSLRAAKFAGKAAPGPSQA